MKKWHNILGMAGVALVLALLGSCVHAAPDAPYITVKGNISGGLGNYYCNVNISWEEVPGADEYIIYYGYGLDPELFTRHSSTRYNYAFHGYRIENPYDTGKIYHYAVKASNIAGTSAFSNVVTW